MSSTTAVQETQQRQGPVAPKQSRNRSKASCIECYRRKQKVRLSTWVGHLCQFSSSKPNVRSDATAKKSKTTISKQDDAAERALSRDLSDNDEPRNERRRASPLSISTTPAVSSLNSFRSDQKSLDGLGYLQNNADNLLGYLKRMDLYDDNELESTQPESSTPKITSEVLELLAKVPHRTVTDILIQHFLSEANWIYEMVDPTTFLERYDDWWSHPCRNAHDVEFAALLLRLCSYTAQFLPSQNYTADTILGASLSTIRQECDATANALASTQFVKLSSRSIVRIHQLFFRACYLKNEGDVKGSWDVLSEATREAQELGLHLDLHKGQGKFISEYDVEMGKRTYWNLWLWDKFMSIILGRWPLIPDERCTVSLPHAVDNNTAPDINAPDTFCERKLQIQLTKLAAELLSSTDGKQSRDPVVIDNHVNRFYAELIDTLPPAFRIHDPELKWDQDLPNLKRQREMFRISIFATLCSMLKPLILTPTDKTQAASASGKKLVARLKTTLIEAIIELLDSVGRLHTLMGGKQNRFFLLSFFTFHPAALLGMCLLSLEGNLKATKQAATKKGTTTKGLQPSDLAQYSEQGRQRMESSMKRLRMLSEVSSIARIGLLLLEKIMAKLNEPKSNKSLKETTAPQNIKRKATASSPSTRFPISPVSEKGSTTQTHIPNASTIPTTIDTNTIFDQPSQPSLTPPDSHSDRSPNSQQMETEMEMEMEMEIPDTWINLDEWSDANGNPNPNPNPSIQNLTNSSTANWDLTLFESEFEKTLEAQLATFSGPSVQWPCHPQSWAFPTTTTTTTTSASNIKPAANAWSIPTTATGQCNDVGMGADAIMAMEQDIDWSWTGYRGN
ncbi:MAG: hypothetical protein Q9200_000443 [Gallowayella weberi]